MRQNNPLQEGNINKQKEKTKQKCFSFQRATWLSSKLIILQSDHQVHKSSNIYVQKNFPFFANVHLTFKSQIQASRRSHISHNRCNNYVIHSISKNHIPIQNVQPNFQKIQNRRY